MSLFPQSLEVAPFAGSTRRLCDRKEVTLNNQMSVSAKFFIYTSTHIASKFTGLITDDFTSEFDPFAPTFARNSPRPTCRSPFGLHRKRNQPRVLGSLWAYNGLNYSTWEVNPPNPTGYSPDHDGSVHERPRPDPGYPRR